MSDQLPLSKARLLKKASLPDAPSPLLDHEQLMQARRWLRSVLADIETALGLKAANGEQRASAERRVERLLQSKESLR